MYYAKTSVYQKKFSDPMGIFFTPESFPELSQAKDDVSGVLQDAIDTLIKEQSYGVLYIPEGEYRIKNTILIPPSVRLIGYGKKRPVFILPKETFNQLESVPHSDNPAAVFMQGYPGARYMFRFIGDRDTAADNPKDANAATFYSAISNIDFMVEDGNPAAICIRAHFAQHGFISHCHFEIGDGIAGIFDVGNEMEDLTFVGGSYGIVCRMTSPGWPFALLDSVFDGQAVCAVLSGMTGFTGFRLHIKNTPKAFDLYLPGSWEKLYLEDCIFENISDEAITFCQPESVIQQTNIKRLYCSDVPILLRKKGVRDFEAEDEASGDSASDKVEFDIVGFTPAGAESYYKSKIIQSVYSDPESQIISDVNLGQDVCTIINSDIYEVEEYSYGYTLYDDEEPDHDEMLILNPVSVLPPLPAGDIPPVPPMESWASVADYGAKGDGITDDTEALRDAVEHESVLYFPQGIYKITDTITLKKDITLFGISPITTQIVIEDDTPAFAGFGTPKALIETAKGGFCYINGIGIDTAGKNPRAAGIKWMADETSYMNDVKFVGGHGLMFRDGRNAYAYLYNASRTADYNPDRLWDYEYSSLWITEGGGGVFKDIWSASPYAEAGIAITNTQTKGTMYAISLEHHVRIEMKLHNVKNWSFYALQTEEEKGEGIECLPLELVSCENILFGNFYLFRVVAVDRPYETGIRLWNSTNIEFLNLHNKAQMQYVFTITLKDETTGFYAKSPEYARLAIGCLRPYSEDDFWSGFDMLDMDEYVDDLLVEDDNEYYEETGDSENEPVYEIVADGFTFAQGVTFDSKGNMYWCDKIHKRIYKYNVRDGVVVPVYDIHFMPSALAIDANDRLIVAADYSELKTTKPGQPYSRHDTSNFHPFFSWFYKRGEKVYMIDPADPFDTMTELEKIPAGECTAKLIYRPGELDYPGMFKLIAEKGIDEYYVTPDRNTAVMATVDLARSLVLKPVSDDAEFLLTDDSSRKTYSYKSDEKGNLSDGRLVAIKGQYNAVRNEDGIIWTVDDMLYAFKGNHVISSSYVPEDAYAVFINDGTVYVVGRNAIYIKR
ncbi:MAG: hypothetical protein IJM37_09510 [Lachnospiraceae bacterium]|nr:hypothetical protein [Lachnospiraceae bacterium]